MFLFTIFFKLVDLKLLFCGATLVFNPIPTIRKSNLLNLITSCKIPQNLSFLNSKSLGHLILIFFEILLDIIFFNRNAFKTANCLKLIFF